MGKIKAFFLKKGVKPSLKLYFIDAMGAMAQGLFASLLIGTILGTIGEKFGIELVPCIQTLAHLATTLRWGYADGMKDTGDILLIDEEKTYEFIEEMIKTSRECYKTDKIHNGMD